MSRDHAAQPAEPFEQRDGEQSTRPRNVARDEERALLDPPDPITAMGWRLVGHVSDTMSAVESASLLQEEYAELAAQAAELIGEEARSLLDLLLVELDLHYALPSGFRRALVRQHGEERRAEVAAAGALQLWLDAGATETFAALSLAVQLDALLAAVARQRHPAPRSA